MQLPYISNGMKGRNGNCWVCESRLMRPHILHGPNHCLSSLSNEKPSAIFKLKGTLPARVSPSGLTDSDTANIGILCEPVQSVHEQWARISASSNAGAASHSGALVSFGTQSTDVTLGIALRLAKHFLNFVSSFAQSATSSISLQSILQDSSAQSALLTLCERWYKNVEAKTRNGVDWINKEQD